MFINKTFILLLDEASDISSSCSNVTQPLLIFANVEAIVLNDEV